MNSVTIIITINTTIIFIVALATTFIIALKNIFVNTINIRAIIIDITVVTGATLYYINN